MKFNAKSTSVRVCAAATLLTCLTGALTAKADDNKTDGSKAAASAQVSDSGKSSDNQSQASDSSKSSDSQAQGSDSSKSSDDGKSGKVVATPTPADGGKYAAAQSPADPMGLPIAGKVEVGGSTAASAAFDKDVLPAATEYIRKHLPESRNNSKFVAVNSLDLSKLTLATTHDVQATFVYEGAGYVNTLGVNTKGNGISGGNPEVIFPAVRSSDSAFASAPAGTRTAQDPLLPGDFVDLGVMQKGTKLDFFLIANGANGGTTDWDTAGKNADGLDHVAAFTPGVFATAQPNSPYLFISFEDLWGGGDKDYNDAIFAINLGTSNVNKLLNTPEPATYLSLGCFVALGFWMKRRVDAARMGETNLPV